MPPLYRLAVHNSLCEVKTCCQGSTSSLSWMTCTRSRCLSVHGQSTICWERSCLRSGDLTPHWQDPYLEPSGRMSPRYGRAQGMKILGTPVGTEAAERLEEEDKLWNAIHWIPDLQCAWQVLVQCASPKCRHLIRTRTHMATIWACNGPYSPFLVSFLGAPTTTSDTAVGIIAAHGGLGSPIVQTEGPSFLGILGRCITHVPEAAAQIGSTDRP